MMVMCRSGEGLLSLTLADVKLVKNWFEVGLKLCQDDSTMQCI